MTEIIKYLNHKVNGNTITYPIGTELKFIESNDSSLLIQTEKTTLDKILPLKVNQETINDKATEIRSFNDIKKQGIYSVQKNLNNGPTNDNSNSSLIVLKVGSIIHQIFFKLDEVYSRSYNGKSWKPDSSWNKNVGEVFTKSNSSKAGTRGLVPEPPKNSQTGNYFLNADGNWITLNSIFARLGESETFTGAPTFNSGFTSKGKITINKVTGNTITTTATIDNTGIGAFNKVSIKKNENNITKDTVAIDNDCNGIFNSININNKKASISSVGTGEFNDINIKVSGTLKASINSNGDGSFNEIKINSNTALNTSENTGAATIAGGVYINGAVKIGNEADTEADNAANTGALLVNGGAYIDKHIRVGTNGGVYGALWNDLADSIVVNKDAEIEAGYCYCLKDNKYVKSSKYLDNGIIGIHSDTYGFKMGEKAGEKQLDCAVAGFVLAYVDKDYLPGTALTCTKDGRLTKIKSKDKQRFPEKIVATYWKDEPNEEWGSDNRKVKVNGRKWVKIK